ncbi:DUF1648 domain-containing protein [Radiobacillus deserti]|uniref:DUF1648 domain-containing protein n=1 Tax=Radiobacillus deserti TaxID=2594883 RepID=A0A516KIC2_9BACI|nr:DUF1648 domain-containing protein [Radiobacillus deserti]QDP41148.1 DUF1648 domain-containing protein [Radiobacillus deserti]
MTKIKDSSKRKLPKTKGEWFWDIIGYSAYIGSIIFLFVIWDRLPEEVPAHYNASGEVDRYGDKQELFILPVVGAFIAVFMQVFERFPEVHNYPSRLNESNAGQFYLLSRKLVNQIKNISLILFAIILMESVSIALEWGNGLGAWFLPIALLSVFIPIVVCIIKQKKIK